jgi:hypothetical protein
MGKIIVSDKDFIEIITLHGIENASDILKASPRSVFYRRRKIERDLGIKITVPDNKGNIRQSGSTEVYPMIEKLQIQDGVILIGSDAHVWPGDLSTGMRGFLHFCKKLSPQAVILNGDVYDGAGNGSHNRIRWSKVPSVREQLDAVENFIDKVVQSSKKSQHLWTIGNHDSRYETMLSNQCSVYEDVDGVCLQDKFPSWKFAMSFWFNNDVVVKHRFKGGIHATHNNTLWSGKNIVTGHLHSLKVTPFSDYNGLRFGVDTGTLNDPYGPHTEYGEHNPVNHREGFIVLTFCKGDLLWPEIVSVWDRNHVQFRGEIIKV